MAQKKTKRLYTIDVDYEYGCIDTYEVEACSRAEAFKKAKDKFIRDYFRKSYLKCSFVTSEEL